jgi:hypothetical protein
MSDVIISIPGATDITVENAAASSVVVTFPASNNFVTTVIDRGVLYGIVGAQGPTGPQGATGPQGIPGIGIAAGGSIGQVLKKASATDYDTAWLTLDKTAVGLSNVDNTSDTNKPISNATQTALNGKQATISLTTTGSSGASTFDANVLNVPNYTLSGLGGQPLNTNLTSISALTFASTSFVKMTATGTFALDTNTYLTAESDTLASVTGRGNVTTNFITIGGLTVNQSITASGGTARANYLNNTLVASANNDILVALDINSTFTNGAFTGVTNTALRVNGNVNLQSSNSKLWSTNSSAYYVTLQNTVFNSVDINGFSAVRLLTGTGIEGMRLFSTSNVVLQNGGTFTDSGFRLDVNGTARIQNQLTTTGSITAASAIARGVYMNQTLVAAANNDVLVGLDIQPTFTTGAFTGVTNYALRVTGVIYTNTYMYSVGLVGNTTLALSSSGTNSISFYTNSTGIERMRIFGATGNLTIQNGGTFTDAGYRLDVVGADSRFNGIRAGLGAGQVAGNTVFGDGALGSNVSGNGIVAIGFEALKNSTSSNNSALGYRAGYLVSSGTNNVLVGQLAAQSLTTGSGNVIIGQAAGVTNSNEVGGTAIGLNAICHTNSIAIGRSATATASNQFVVGSTSYNAGAVTTATAVQTKTWDVIINGVAQKILLA